MTDTLALFAQPWALFIIGLCVGSFLNVVIYRLPLMMERQWKMESASFLGLEAQAQEAANAGDLNLLRPASRCSACGHQIRWFENIPLFSWLFLKGKCSACAAPISARYPLIEVLTAVLFAAVGYKLEGQPVALLWCGFVATLVALSGIDWDTTLLPDSMTLPLLWAGLVAAALGWTVPLPQALWGAVVGYLSLWSVYWLFKLVTGKEGMGYGDFKLLAALGAWLGWPMVLPIILGSSIIGAVVGIVMKLSGQLREGKFVPFGPFLAGAGLAVMLIGAPTILSWLGWSAP